MKIEKIAQDALYIVEDLFIWLQNACMGKAIEC